MTPERARKVLTDMPSISLTPTSLTNDLDLINSEIGDNQDSGPRKIQLDGYFTADQLEAIATWIRHPLEVAGEPKLDGQQQ